MGSDSVKSNDFSSGSDLQDLAKQWFPLMSKRELSEEDLQAARRLQGQFSTLPDADRERLKDIIRQMQTDRKPMFLGGPKPDPENAMSPAEEARARVSDKFGASIGDVLGRVGQGARMLGNAMLGTYGKIRDAESDPRMPSDMRKDEIAERMSIAPDVMVPASATRLMASKGFGELGALGGKGFGPEKTSITEWAKTLRDEGYTNADIARTLTRHYSKPGVEITPRDVAESLGVEKGPAVENAMPGYGGRREGSGRPPNPLKAPAMDELAVRDLPILGVDPRFRELQQALADKFPGTPTATINNWIMEYQGKGKWAGQGSLKEGTIKNGPASISPPQAARAEAGDDVLRGPVINPDQGELELGALGGKGRNAWTPEMVATLRTLNEQGGSRADKIKAFRDAHPGYDGSDGTLTVQMSKIARNGDVNAGLSPGPQTGKLTSEQQQTISDLASNPDMTREAKVRAFRDAHGDVASYGTIVRRLKDAEGGDFELGAMGGRGSYRPSDMNEPFNVKMREPGNLDAGTRISPDDIRKISAGLGLEVRSERVAPSGSTYSNIYDPAAPKKQYSTPSADPNASGRPEIKVRVPSEENPHSGYPEQWLIDTNTRDATPNLRNSNLAGEPYEGNPQAVKERLEYAFGKQKPAAEPPRNPADEVRDPRQLKLLASGAPIPPFETTVEQEPGTSTFAKSPDIRQSQDELLASSTRHLADKAQALNNEAEDLTSYPRLRFGLPPGFVLDKSNAMEP